MTDYQGDPLGPADDHDMPSDYCKGCGTIFEGDLDNGRQGHAEHCPVWLGEICGTCGAAEREPCT